MSFDKKVVLVTGASSGIGAAIAIKFTSEGAKVAIVGRNQDKLNAVAEKCEKAGSRPLTIFADVTRDGDLKKVVNETLQKFGHLDVLINNAGMFSGTGIEDANCLAVFDHTMATNLRSVICLTHLAAPHLIETKGNIINVSSMAAKKVMSRSVVYGTSKAALDHFSKSVALELAQKGVRVNCVNPGPVKTDLFENAGYNEAIQGHVWNTLLAGTALGRVADPEEIADLVLFLASDKAKSITGSSYVTDNGSLLK